MSERTSASGGAMQRLGPVPPGTPGEPGEPGHLEVLEGLRLTEPGHERGLAPHARTAAWEPGTVIAWWYGRGCALLRVVSDDERGLVAWLPTGSEALVSTPSDGRGLREVPLAERFAVPRAPALRAWQGQGVLRVLPRDAPWSVWLLGEGDAFVGHYVNLELPHRRPLDGSPRTHSRDLVLDLWLEDGEVWLKDADELEATVPSGHFTAAEADAVRRLGERAHRELVAARSWPLDEDAWTTWRPAPEWDRPLAFEDLERSGSDDPVTRDAVARARAFRPGAGPA
ncbi:DUF402 domain-containing protein [Nocardioides sp. GY 10127]|uniref:DUF402 domain-containing protein n=1 Tax=Nocardioides sp. GY 10127 TaxID=2569762 RepID=UPI0010A7531D|nr:DUF402 domain-containing protein [Nocardioides sp. GY 10127]TIC86449.1 DUF402 domain-containing protein [Nocardioides sp. GY 10127]